MQKIITIILIGLLVVNIFYVFVGVAFHPLQSEDAIGIWLFKAKAFYVENGLPVSFLHNPNYSYSHQQYPLGIPFLFFLIYKAIGGVKDQVLLLLYPFIYFTVIVLVYKTLRKMTSINSALLFTYIYSMLSPLIAAGGRILAGNADIFLTLIEWIVIFILYKKKLQDLDYVFITLLIMVASQIKLEGIFLSIIILFLPLSKKFKLSLFFISLIPFFIWLFTVYSLKIPSDTHIVIPSISGLLARLEIIFSGVIKELLNINNWYIFWPLLGVLLFIKSKLSLPVKYILLPSYAIMMSLYIMVYLFSSTDTYKYINSSFDRVLFQHSAIAFLFFFEKIKSTNSKLIFS